ncbi:hypothetical protein E4U30_001531 [Claviceps sp. LM220 group G6]|nr:hypothetical protein E4U30_001531 [Claviceps sp. LM220 group G6]
MQSMQKTGGQVLDHAPWFVACSRRKVLTYIVPLFQAVELAAFITGVPIPAAMMPVVLIFNPPPKTVGTDGVWVKGQLLNGLIRKGSPEHWYILATGLSRSAYATSGSVPRRAAYVVDTFPFEPLAFSLRQDTSTQ